jgi:rhodanese-related sulfurtransferase
MSTLTTPAAPVTGFRRIDAALAADLIERHRQGALPQLALFDVRDRQSFERASVSGATYLAEAVFPRLVRQTPRTTPVVIYCYHGNASQTWAGMFADFRYNEVYSVDGGYEALDAALAGAAAAAGPRLPETADAALHGFIAEYGFDAGDLDAPRAHGLTPLMRAALLGRPDLVEALLALGVNVNAKNGDGNNALWLACVSDSAAVIDRLIAAGIDKDNRNDMGATVLMYTASAGKHQMVAHLLAAGADPHLRNYDDAKAVDLCATLPCLRLLRHTAG